MSRNLRYQFRCDCGRPVRTDSTMVVSIGKCWICRQPVRDKLRPFVGRRLEYSATMERLGWHDRGYVNVCFAEVRSAAGELVADHLWMPWTGPLVQMELRPRERVRFTAVAATYHKRGGALDYRLRDMRDAVRISADHDGGKRSDAEAVSVDGVSKTGVGQSAILHAGTSAPGLQRTETQPAATREALPNL